MRNNFTFKIQLNSKSFDETDTTDAIITEGMKGYANSIEFGSLV